MAPSTKLALANALKSLLQKKFLDDITVKEIVEDCEVNRQTFYYHFQDIYDLLRWLLHHETEQALRDAPTWQEALRTAFRYIQENHMVIFHVYRSDGRDYLDSHFFTLARALVISLLDREGSPEALSSRDREFLIDFYMYALAGTLLGWLADDMKEDPEELVNRICRLLEGEFQRAAEGLLAPPQDQSAG